MIGRSRRIVVFGGRADPVRCRRALTRKAGLLRTEFPQIFDVIVRTIKVAVVPPGEAPMIFTERTPVSERTSRFERT